LVGDVIDIIAGGGIMAAGTIGGVITAGTIGGVIIVDTIGGDITVGIGSIGISLAYVAWRMDASSSDRCSSSAGCTFFASELEGHWTRRNTVR
jgi:hypothetical protein